MLSQLGISVKQNELYLKTSTVNLDNQSGNWDSQVTKYLSGGRG